MIQSIGRILHFNRLIDVQRLDAGSFFLPSMKRLLPIKLSVIPGIWSNWKSARTLYLREDAKNSRPKIESLALFSDEISICMGWNKAERAFKIPGRLLTRDDPILFDIALILELSHIAFRCKRAGT